MFSHKKYVTLLSVLFLWGCLGGGSGESRNGSSSVPRFSTEHREDFPAVERVVTRSGDPHSFPGERFCSLQAPVRLGLELVSAPNTAGHLELVARVTTTVPINEATIALIFPSASGETLPETRLWSGAIKRNTSREVMYRLPPLPDGKHILTVYLGLETDVRGLTSGFSRSLYIQVRRSGVSWSDVSFNHLDMLELKKRIKELGLDGLSFEQLRIASPKLAARVVELHDVRLARPGQPSKLKGTDKERRRIPASFRLRGARK